MVLERPWLRILWGVLLSLLLPGVGLVYAGAFWAGVAALLLDEGLSLGLLAVTRAYGPAPGPFGAFMALGVTSLLLHLLVAAWVGLRLRAPPPARPWWRRALVALPVWVAAMLGIDALTPELGWESFYVPSASMEPTLLVGDRFLADVRDPGERPGAGAVVVFSVPDPDGGAATVYVKRAIGLPGDRVAVRSGHLAVNGQPTGLRVDPAAAQDGSLGYVERLPGAAGDGFRIRKTTSDGPWNDTPEYMVPPGNLFVLGDNRDNSLDSRALGVRGGGPFGFVPFPDVKGTAAMLFWPPSRALGTVR